MSTTPVSSATENMVRTADFRDAMARLAAAVSIVTTDGPAGRAAFTASAVTSVTDTPPALLVCLNRSASVYRTFLDNGVLCVNTLAGHHEELSRLFGGKTPMAERFAAAQWHSLPGGSPILDAAAVSFDCRVTRIVHVGTHDILICEILAIVKGEATPALVYFNRRYHRLDHGGELA